MATVGSPARREEVWPLAREAGATRGGVVDGGGRLVWSVEAQPAAWRSALHVEEQSAVAEGCRDAWRRGWQWWEAATLHGGTAGNGGRLQRRMVVRPLVAGGRRDACRHGWRDGEVQPAFV